jgi:hypothetical protein
MAARSIVHGDKPTDVRFQVTYDSSMPDSNPFVVGNPFGNTGIVPLNPGPPGGIGFGTGGFGSSSSKTGAGRNKIDTIDQSDPGHR